MRRLTSAAVAVLALIVVSGCSSSSKKSSSGGPIDGVKTIEVKHGHKGGRIEYAEKPPVGGVHSNAWLRCDIYTSAVPNESAVHSLEHGAVWITYLDSVSATDIATLAKLDDINIDYVLISPYPGQPAPVMATAWGLQLSVDSAADPRLKAFVKAHAGGDQGGEPGADCRNAGVTPDKAEEYITQGG